MIDFIGIGSYGKVKAEDLSLSKIQQMSKCNIFDVKSFANRSNTVDIYFEIKYE